MMQYLILFIPVIFSAAAQVLVKYAANFEIKSLNWFIFIGISLVSYGLAFVLYSFTVRQFPVSVASPVNTISVMIIVFIFGILMFGEAVTIKQFAGIVFGLLSVILLIPA